MTDFKHLRELEEKRTTPLLWATYGLTDSGDDLPILLWGHEPSKDEVDARYSAILPDEYSECGGVSWDIQELGEVIP